jgi:hypothetical protein
MKDFNLGKFKLGSGGHKSIEDGACIMEMVAYLADEPWSDHPKCACPILTDFAMRLNDRWNDEERQLLKPFITRLISTKSTDEAQVARKRLIRWRYVTVSFPLLLDLWKLPDVAVTLRAFQNTIPSMALAKIFLNDNRSKIEKLSKSYAAEDVSAAAYAYADAYVSAYAYADAYVYTYADAYAYTYTYAYAYAYAYADAYVHASVDAADLKAELVKTSLETLSMAIEIRASDG